MQKKSCFNCVNLEYEYCEKIEHHISSGYGAIVHAKHCEHYQKKQEVET